MPHTVVPAELLEREQELADLGALAAAGRRDGTLVLLEGVAGIGKTALLRAAPTPPTWSCTGSTGRSPTSPRRSRWRSSSTTCTGATAPHCASSSSSAAGSRGSGCWSWAPRGLGHAYGKLGIRSRSEPPAALNGAG